MINKTNGDLIYFPFPMSQPHQQDLKSFNRLKMESKKITNRQSETSDSSISKQSEGKEKVEATDEFRTKDIFSSAKKIRSKESRVSLRYGLDIQTINTHDEIGQSIQKGNL
uniref:Uncharacterized protein n=1 Tax=Euplotes harpa TaxID=151035 RepID=A0A7S3NCF2_9SPIT|mmetsp:Transcript_36036/g.41618  ORF Transcript_36036/g.41618 Transcript_36036/m.41618 type:complete len:111 (+) Transcript_36036:623-955(+)